MHYTYVGSVYALSRTKTREGFGYIGYQKFGTRIVQKGLMWLVILYIAANQLTLLCTENGSTPYYVQSTWAC